MAGCHAGGFLHYAATRLCSVCERGNTEYQLIQLSPNVRECAHRIMHSRVHQCISCGRIRLRLQRRPSFEKCLHARRTITNCECNDDCVDFRVLMGARKSVESYARLNTFTCYHPSQEK